MVVWLIGLSGSGKTTLAEAIVKKIHENNGSAVLLDGDSIREIFGNDLGYTVEDRLKNAQRICQLGQFLQTQGLNVIVPILSIFPETRQWNRENLDSYYEVFIDTPMADLISRDGKGLYGGFQANEMSNVVGMDIDFPIPENPDLIIENSGSLEKFLSYSSAIAKKLMG
jgi:adenylylsulfate kinase-like enzyme